jgi:cation transporter-like permease
VQQAADLPNEQLDEREIAVRDRCYLEAYRLLGGALAVSLVLAIVDDAVGEVVVSWNGVWAAVLLLSAVLPSAVLAYRQQGDSDGD